MTTTDDDPRHPFTDKRIEDIDAIEHGGRLMAPTAFTRRGAGGEIIRVPVLLGECLLRDRGIAKVEAIKYVDGLVEQKIRTVPEAEAAVGADVFEQFDSAALVSLCCFDVKPPHHRHQTLSGMCDTYGIRQVLAMFRELDAWTGMCATDVRDVADEQMWPMLETIARVKHIGPLAVLPGDAQRSFIVRTAGLALSSRPRS